MNLQLSSFLSPLKEVTSSLSLAFNYNFFFFVISRINSSTNNCQSSSSSTDTKAHVHHKLQEEEEEVVVVENGAPLSANRYHCHCGGGALEFS